MLENGKNQEAKMPRTKDGIQKTAKGQRKNTKKYKRVSDYSEDPIVFFSILSLDLGILVLGSLDPGISVSWFFYPDCSANK